MRPWSNSSPLRNTVGHGHHLAGSSTSSWNSAPSMATWVMFGLRTLIRLSACTTSGQFWHESEK